MTPSAFATVSRVFAAELMLMTLAMAASNYATGEALDRFQISPRAVAAAIGLFFLLPGLLWLLTRRRWDRERVKAEGPGD